jgi:hypothetical protein
MAGAVTLTDPDGAVSLRFTAFSTEEGYDLVTVYQGLGTGGPVLWSNSGDLTSQLPVLVTGVLVLVPTTTSFPSPR